MTNMTPESSGSERESQADTDAALQRELARQRAEGRDAIGDVAANRNLTGSSTWETLPAVPNADGGPATGSTRPSAQRPTADDDEFQRAQEEIAVRLRRRGVHLTGQETGEELTEALEAVERFEEVVQRSGGDLMVDEPVHGGAPIAPDHQAFVLPQRHEQESIHAFIERVAVATSRAKKHGNEPQ